MAAWLAERRAVSIDRRYGVAYSTQPEAVDDIDGCPSEDRPSRARRLGRPRLVRRGEVRWADIGTKRRPLSS